MSSRRLHLRTPKSRCSGLSLYEDIQKGHIMRNCQVLLGITILGTALVGACSNGGAGTQASGGAGGSSSTASGTGGDNGAGGISNSGGATGGRSGSGGTVTSGGATATGGATSAGGTMGGNTVGSGGNTPTGGSISTGGVTGAGGATGGTTRTGGAAGGNTATGGSGWRHDRHWRSGWRQHRYWRSGRRQRRSDGQARPAQAARQGAMAEPIGSGGIGLGRHQQEGAGSSGSGGSAGHSGGGGSIPSGPAVAFPGALGFGKKATGGRGNAVYHVTNLNDSGTGSFRDAVSAGNRIVVFDVGGYVVLTTAVSVSSDLTIAGQTAPGDGIGFMGFEVSFNAASNVIVRYVRFRQGLIDPDWRKSGINLLNGSNMIFDHISIEFAQYNNIDAVGATNITMQYSINADPTHQQFGAHTEGGGFFTWYANLWANAHGRLPLAKANTQFVNNVAYNYQYAYCAGDTGGSNWHDIINNYFIAGPSTTSPGDDFYQMNAGQTVYASGNLLDSNADGTLNGTDAGQPGGTTKARRRTRRTPLACPPPVRQPHTPTSWPTLAAGQRSAIKSILWWSPM